jgi:hypothetical protein
VTQHCERDTPSQSRHRIRQYDPVNAISKRFSRPIDCFCDRSIFGIEGQYTVCRLIIYALNLALEDDPANQRIREQFIPPSMQDMLDEVRAEIEGSGADLDRMRNVIEERLKARGLKTEAEMLEKDLRRLEKRVRTKASDRLTEIIKRAESSATSKPKV